MVQFEFPLQWIPGQKRTRKPVRARFENHGTSKAGDFLIDELRKLGARQCVISSNLQPRKRGSGFYANQTVDDAGVVVYFKLDGADKAMACDQWDRVDHNLWALYLSVAAIRGLERWGGSQLLDGLFTGFKALPSPDDVIVSGPQYFADCDSLEHVRQRYRTLAKELHPDVNNGESKEFSEMVRQYEIAKNKLKAQQGVGR